MKRLMRSLAVLAALILAAALAGCGSSGNVLPTELPEGETAPFSEDDMRIVIDGAYFKTGVDVTEVLKAMGDNYVCRESPSCIRPGMEKTFEFDGLMIKTVPSGGRDIVCYYGISGGDFKTARGIGAGSTQEEAFLRYGTPPFDGYYFTFSASSDPNDLDADRIQFAIENGCVIEIDVYSPSAGL